MAWLVEGTTTGGWIWTSEMWGTVIGPKAYKKIITKRKQPWTENGLQTTNGTNVYLEK